MRSGIAIVTVMVCALGIWYWRRLPKPTPPALFLWRKAGGRNHESEAAGWLTRRRPLTVHAGDNVCVYGDGANAAVQFWLAQIGAPVTVTNAGWQISLPEGDATVFAAPTFTPAATLNIEVKKAPALGKNWFEEAGGTGPSTELPCVVLAKELLAPQWTVEKLWEHPTTDVPLGISESGTVCVDLAKMGPHALVAGTTGSGKSEALITWLLMLALHNPPSQLNFILVDYKGGEAFAPLAKLPHTCAVLTDLAPAQTTRALSSLRAELRRREQQKAAGTNMGPRLVIVVDEFREVSLTHPHVLQDLTRIAALGRSLGISLVLATQRPGGNIDSNIRANTAITVCLRVRGAAESTDILGDARAATLPTIPGRAFIDSGVPVLTQIAYVPDPAGIVSKICAASNGTTAWPPWLPELSHDIQLADAAATCNEPIVLGIADYPQQQAQNGIGLAADVGLQIITTAGSGGTTAAKTIACQFARVHVATPAPTEWEDFADTVVSDGADMALLLRRAPAAELVIVDDFDSVLDRIDSAEGVGEGIRLITQLHGNRAIICSPASGNGKWAETLRTKLIMGNRDAFDAARTGVSKTEAAWLDAPGRALLVQRQRTCIQIAQPELRRCTTPLIAPTPAHIPAGELGLIGAQLKIWQPPQSNYLVVSSKPKEAAKVQTALAKRLPKAAIITVTPNELMTDFGGKIAKFLQEATLLWLRPNRATRTWAAGHDLTGLINHTNNSRIIPALAFCQNSPERLFLSSCDYSHRSSGKEPCENP
ncbi:MAG: FtsK/SpoIIIE domain-containing protein [Actinomycetaceae bacterium]|nr:FtsK/SpoIIIE domain-containing protein [Actinomycetaceae bacterium]